jgi:hypothetical protein
MISKHCISLARFFGFGVEQKVAAGDKKAPGESSSESTSSLHCFLLVVLTAFTLCTPLAGLWLSLIHIVQFSPLG